MDNRNNRAPARSAAAQPARPNAPVLRRNMTQPIFQMGFALDKSTSEGRTFDNDTGATRWEVNVATTITTLRAAKRNERLRDVALVYLVLFGDDVEWVLNGVPLKTLSIDALEAKLLDIVPFGTTALGKAVTTLTGKIRADREAYGNECRRVVAQPIVVVVSDGNNTSADNGAICEDEPMQNAYKMMDEMLPVNKIVLLTCGVSNKGVTTDFYMLDRLMQADPRGEKTRVIREVSDATQWFHYVVGTLRQVTNLNVRLEANDEVITTAASIQDRIQALREGAQNRTPFGQPVDQG